MYSLSYKNISDILNVYVNMVQNTKYILFLLFILPISVVTADTYICISEPTWILQEPNVNSLRWERVEDSHTCYTSTGNQSTSPNGDIFTQIYWGHSVKWILNHKIYRYTSPDNKPEFRCACTTSAVWGVSDISKSKNHIDIPAKTCLTLLPDQQNLHKGFDFYNQVVYKNKSLWVSSNFLSFHYICNISQNHIASPNVEFTGCPRIYARSEWGARASTRALSKLRNVPAKAFIHHGATAECHLPETCVRSVQSYQNYHIDGHGWNDIGYSFLIGGDGSIFEGRGWDSSGAHTPGYNTASLGICLIGNFMSHDPTAAALESLKQLLNCGAVNQKLTPNYSLYGHRDAHNYTVCPGDKLYNIIQTWSQYNLTPL